jgi:hypothetical protein
MEEPTAVLTETEIRVKALEDEFAPAKNELKQIMLDIRALLMEAASPLRSQRENNKASNQNDHGKR